MATTIISGFQKLKENLEISGLQAATTSSRQQNVRDNVTKEMTVECSFLTGSYVRSTMIAPLSAADIDIFLVMNSKYFSQDGQASLLDKVKRALAKAYNNSEISRDGQAVTIRFTDFWVDVVPGFDRQGGGFLIPDTIQKRWISTDPTKHVELWSALNAKRNGKFVPLVKMLKCWNRAHSLLLRSFHLETLAYDIFQNTTISDYATAAQYFFNNARSKITFGVLDPAGFGGNVGSYLDTQTKKDEVTSRMKTAYEKATEAIDYAGKNQIESAFGKWRIIFGNYFPAYG
ncbi:MAG: CBASS oligonucleotide cyclase [Planctomycetota bacterium]